MEKTNVIIVHGSNESEQEAKTGGVENTRHWHPWLKKELEKGGVLVSGELYPRDWAPEYNVWKTVFEKNKINQNTILIGHSAGCAFILRWLMESKKKVNKVILVAPYLKDDGIANWLKPFVDFNFDKAINEFCKEIIIFYDAADMAGIVESVKLAKEKFSPKIIALKNYGHFTLEDMGTEEFPELLEEILR